jgi:uncharacterized protein involved in exopolysaccharide biosynthesis
MNNEHARLDMTSLLTFVLKWRKPLLIVTLGSILVSAIVSGSYFMPPKYKATVILYSSKTYSLSKSLLGEAYGPDYLQFGEEEEAEQLIQVINSDEVKDHIIQKFDLITHYGLDPESKTIKNQIYKTYDENVNVERTPLMSVRIEVLDETPQFAADIANEISMMIDTSWSKVAWARAAQALEILEKEVNERENYLAGLEDSLKFFRKKGVYLYDDQAKVLDKRYAKALAAYHDASGKHAVYEKELGSSDKKTIDAKAKKKGAEQTISNLLQRHQIISEYGGNYQSLRDLAYFTREELVKIKVKLENTRVDAREFLSPKFVVNKATVPDKKAYPVRWLIVVISAISSLLLSMIIIILLEKYREVKQIMN